MTDDSKPVTNPGQRAAIALVLLIVLTAGLFWFDPENFYLWAKALHVIAVISWMAGLLYLPRLFVYHTEAGAGTPQAETFKIMEGRLLRIIINPAMMLTWVFGLWLAWEGFLFQGTWLYLKIAAVVALSAVHGHFAKHVRLFAEDRLEKPARHWRMMNEVPAVLMIAIVVLVIVKPFQ